MGLSEQTWCQISLTNDADRLSGPAVATGDVSSFLRARCEFSAISHGYGCLKRQVCDVRRVRNWGSYLTMRDNERDNGAGAARMAAHSPDGATAAAGAAADRLRALSAAGISLYEWDVQSDVITWDATAHALFGLAVDPELARHLDTGRAYARLIDPDAGTARYDAVMASDKIDRGDGVSFQCEYAVQLPGMEHAVWVEDAGIWYAGETGRPGRVVGAVRNVSERKRSIRKLTYLASYDELTGNVNRARLREVLSQTIAYGERFDRTSAFLMAGIDNLAMINEAYGFDVADQVIVAVSQRLREELRQADILGRVAGNKFGIILSNCREEQIVTTAERLMDCVRGKVIDTGAGPVSATISIGCVSIPRCAHNATEALSRAEETLDAAKATRRGAYALYQLSEQRESRRKRNIQLADQIVAALKEDRLLLAYQPIIAAKTGEAELHEALLRMRRPDGEIVSAGEFIPVAEQLGLARLIDHRVLELAVRTLRTYPSAHLAINVSGMTAVDRSWIDAMTAFAAETPDITSRLIVEITETVALHELEESARFVRDLRSLGCRVAIDDFGAGYTSFRNLKALDVDMVKIDGSFVKGLVRSRDDQLFVQTLVHLAKNFNLPVVAEWVGNEDEVTLLRAYGVDYLQGFFLGEPVIEAPWSQTSAISASAVSA